MTDIYNIFTLYVHSISGPKASGGDADKGCGFRGPGETKMETDKRAIREKIVLLTREISLLGMQREQHRKSR